MTCNVCIGHKYLANTDPHGEAPHWVPVEPVDDRGKPLLIPVIACPACTPSPEMVAARQVVEAARNLRDYLHPDRDGVRRVLVPVIAAYDAAVATQKVTLPGAKED